MILISHRGNIYGPIKSWENEPSYIDLAISKGYDVEVDVWYINDNFYLGHDSPSFITDFTWFKDRLSKLWIHCKNIESVIFFNKNNHKFNYFWHESDTLTLTSFGYVWSHVNSLPIENSISVMPEINNKVTTNCIGICSDYIEKYK